MTDEARARALLDAVVRASSPSPDRAERSLALVEARIVADVEPPIAVTVTRAGSPRELLRFAAIAVAIAAVTLLVIREVAVGVTALRAAPEPATAAGDVVDPPVSEQAQPRVDTTARVVVPEPAITTDLPVPAPLEPARPPAARRARDTAVVAPPVEVEGVEAELALVRAAKAEADDLAALTLLDRHADRFPRGVLAPEREMLRAERLCALGRSDDARAVAARFLADDDDHPLARRMRKVCVDP
jgi:hypothetical protein